MMKENGIDSIRETYESSKPDKSVNTGAFDIEEKLVMAEDGYGVAAVEGEREGQKVSVKSGQNQIFQAIANVSSLSFEDLLGKLMDKFNELKSRIKS